MDYLKKISVVIPAKNEENTIAICIGSVQMALKNIASHEIILVDSCSTDNTLDIAKKYPIKIYRLKKKWHISPSAGRYIGTIKSEGEYIFFLDADMTVDKNWIRKGIEHLDQDEELAGVTGRLYNILPNNNSKGTVPIKHPVGYVDYLPGPAMYRHKILKNVNHFNPYLYGSEEKELGYRIIEKGYKQKRLNDPIAYHFVKRKDLNEMLEKSRYFVGVGQYLRLHFKLTNIISIIKKYKLIFILNICMLLFVTTIVPIFIWHNVYLKVSAILITLILFAILFFKNKNIGKTCLLFVSLFLSSARFFYGFSKMPKISGEYPIDAETIK